MKYTLLTLSLLIMIGSNVCAEEAITKDNANTQEIPSNLTYAGIGGITINTTDVNNSLSGLGYPSFPGNFITFGTGSKTISGKIVTGGEGFFTMENKILNPQNQHKGYNSSSFSLIGDIGYVVYQDSNFRVYPLIGAGIGRVFVDLFRDEQNPNYKDLIKSPDKGIALASTNILADLAVAADYTIGLGKSRPQKGGINVGLRAGYLFTIYSTGLQLKGETIKDAPEINNNGFYLRLNLGYTNGIIPALLDIF